tara:strand:+ start:1674 stop:1778 length:105 start_codon:yes stop_codon:yes gene_type:complete
MADNNELMPIDDWEARMEKLGNAVSEMMKIQKGA